MAFKPFKPQKLKSSTRTTSSYKLGPNTRMTVSNSGGKTTTRTTSSYKLGPNTRIRTTTKF